MLIRFFSGDYYLEGSFAEIVRKMDRPLVAKLLAKKPERAWYFNDDSAWVKNGYDLLLSFCYRLNGSDGPHDVHVVRDKDGEPRGVIVVCRHEEEIIDIRITSFKAPDLFFLREFLRIINLLVKSGEIPVFVCYVGSDIDKLAKRYCDKYWRGTHVENDMWRGKKTHIYNVFE